MFSLFRRSDAAYLPVEGEDPGTSWHPDDVATFGDLTDLDNATVYRHTLKPAGLLALDSTRAPRDCGGDL